eukprot:PhF_6_TR27170/c2_g2_i1/m.39804
MRFRMVLRCRLWCGFCFPLRNNVITSHRYDWQFLTNGFRSMYTRVGPRGKLLSISRTHCGGRSKVGFRNQQTPFFRQLCPTLCLPYLMPLRDQRGSRKNPSSRNQTGFHKYSRVRIKQKRSSTVKYEAKSDQSTWTHTRSLTKSKKQTSTSMCRQ